MGQTHTKIFSKKPKRRAVLRDEPIVIDRKPEEIVTVTPKSVEAKKIIKKLRQRKVKLVAENMEKIDFDTYIAKMIAMGCISLNTKKGKTFIPDELEKKCRLCTVQYMGRKKRKGLDLQRRRCS